MRYKQFSKHESDWRKNIKVGDIVKIKRYNHWLDYLFFWVTDKDIVVSCDYRTITLSGYGDRYTLRRNDICIKE